MWKHLIWIAIWVLVGASFSGMIKKYLTFLPNM
jgi:hypothetical protein